MEAARAAVSKITGRHGHTTDVDEYVNPAVTSETVKPHRHEETTEAIDREVHQHHYHTTVQPIAHREVVPEKHTHNILPQVEREFRHDNEAETNRRVSAELAQFANTSTIRETTHSREAAPTVTGEHVHHHVHETVQPVIHKETVQPEVVHTTVPIHEVHQASAQHHGLSALPMKTLDEFTKAGGLISGSKSHTHEQYEGAPRPYNEKLTTTIEKVLPGHHGDHSGTHHNTLGNDGLNSRTGASTGIGSGIGSDRHTGTGIGSGIGSDRHTGIGSDRHTGTGIGSGIGSDRHTGTGIGSGIGSSRPDSGVGGVGNNTLGTHNKPTMSDRMNPRVDADRDGKAGIMD